MENLSTPQSIDNTPKPTDLVLPRIGQQLTYPLDHVSQEIIRQYVQSAIQAFPIGSIFIGAVATNPATLLGYGTWSAFATGRTLVGIDSGQTEFDTLEETGGAKTHTLTTSEIPAHTHGVDYWANPGATPSIQGANLFASAGQQTSGSTGGGASHNNLQPYIVVYMWKRTA